MPFTISIKPEVGNVFVVDVTSQVSVVGEEKVAGGVVAPGYFSKWSNVEVDLIPARIIGLTVKPNTIDTVIAVGTERTVETKNSCQTKKGS